MPHNGIRPWPVVPVDLKETNPAANLGPIALNPLLDIRRNIGKTPRSIGILDANGLRRLWQPPAEFPQTRQVLKRAKRPGVRVRRK